MRIAMVSVLLLACAAWAADPDRDGDGLSDFHERHKYFTDPDKADSDGDGIPDGDADERREYTYTVRTVVQVMRPVDDPPVPDDYQDARVLERHEDWVKLEVVHYPLNTVAAGITADPKWRRSAQQMHEYLRPGLTSNWDEPMRAELLERMRRDGIVIAKLTDKDANEVLRLTLTARGPIDESTRLSDGLDLGRRVIVLTFRDITSKEAHAFWELEQ